MIASAAREQTRQFVARYCRGNELGDGEDIFSSGYVNSLFALQLVQFVERTFAIAVAGEDLELDNFRSIDAIMCFAERKLAVEAL